LYRGNIWAALLEVDGDVDGKYVAVDKETPTHTDRQVSVFYLTAVYPSTSLIIF
jgi:TBC domain-containing protein kinase-like protein